MLDISLCFHLLHEGVVIAVTEQEAEQGAQGPCGIFYILFGFILMNIDLCFKMKKVIYLSFQNNSC